MATIASQLRLNDGMSSVLRSVSSALDTCLSSFEQVQAASGQAIDVQNITDARVGLSEANSQIEQMEANLRRVEDQQNGVNQSFRAGDGAAGNVLNKITQMAAAYLSMKAAKDFFMGNIEMAGEYQRADAQLRVVLQNAGATYDTYQQILGVAKDIQATSLYSDTAMIAGAAELSTYISDAEALSATMRTLSDYATGMAGGTEVSAKQMTEYATQLGKAFMGAYDGISKKGFELSDAQKEILKTGDDMQKAMVIESIITESWGSLSEEMANLPINQVTRMTNEWNSFRRELGETSFPAFTEILQNIQGHMPQIQQIFQALIGVIIVLVGYIGNIINAAAAVVAFFQNNWSWIAPIIYGIVAAFVAWKVITLIMTAVQWALNTALLANPITWIIIAIFAIVAAIMLWADKVGGLRVVWLIVVNAILSAWDWVKIAFFTGVYWVLDLWDKMKLGMMTAGTAIANFMGDMKANVLMILQNMVNGAINIINGFIGILNKIPGVNIGLIEQVTFGTTAQLENEAAKQARLDNLDAYRSEIEAGIMEREGRLQAMQDTAAAAQAERLAEIADLQAARAAGIDEEATDTTPNWNAQEQTGLLGDIADNTGSTAQSLKNMSEDLIYMRDVAEREAVNRFTTAEIKVDMTGMTNRIDGNQDIDGIINRFVDGITEALSVTAEGVYA